MLGSRALILTAALALPVPACGPLELFAPGADARHSGYTGVHPVTTDAGTYTLVPDWVGLKTTIGIRFQNQSERTMYIVNCHGALAPTLQKQVNGSWVDFWSPVLMMCLSPPIVVKPGEVLEAPIHVWGALPGHNAGPAWASADVPGTYRMVLGAVVWDYADRGEGFGEPVPVELRVSNVFSLRR